MNLSPLILAVRAIATEFANRIYLPVVVIAGSILFVLLILFIWLVTLSGWWWFGLVPVIFVSIIFTILATITGFLIYLLKPSQSKTQKRKVKSFVDGIQKSAEAVQTPKFLLLIRLIKDVVMPGSRSYVRELASTATDMKADLQDIIDSFKNQ